MKDEKKLTEKIGIEIQKNSNDSLTKQTWEFLMGNVRKYITISNLFVFLGGVMNLELDKDILNL